MCTCILFYKSYHQNKKDPLLHKPWKNVKKQDLDELRAIN